MKRRLLIVLATVGMALGGVLPATAQAAPQVPEGLSVAVQAEIAAGEATFIDEATLAATGCGSTCDDKNPQTFKIYHSGCSTCYHYCADDADTVRRGISASLGLQLRYSPRCRKAYAWASVGPTDYYTSPGY